MLYQTNSFPVLKVSFGKPIGRDEVGVGVAAVAAVAAVAVVAATKPFIF